MPVEDKCPQNRREAVWVVIDNMHDLQLDLTNDDEEIQDA